MSVFLRPSAHAVAAIFRWIVAACAIALSSGFAIAAGPFEQQGNSRWIIFASRQNVEEAIGLARIYAIANPDNPSPGTTKVMSTTNGWYAVTTGPFRVQNPEALKKKLAESWFTPHDAFLSKGQTFIEQVWQSPPSPILAIASTSEHASRTAAAAGVEVAITAQSKKYVISVRADGRQVSELSFENSSTANSVGAEIAKLDPSSPFPQVVATNFSGGAHCCTEMTVVTFTDNNWRTIKVGGFDGGGPAIEDLNGDGNAEFVGKDDSFNYAFASYAESYAPPIIFRLVGREIKNVTRSPEFRRPIEQLLLIRQRAATFDVWTDNGFLAGWVAHKTLLGEGAPAWQQMLQSYNRNSDWDLTECAIAMKNGDPCPPAYQRHPDFPTALKNKMTAAGYDVAGLTDPSAAAPAPNVPAVLSAPAAPIVSAPTASPPLSGSESVVMLKSDGGGFTVPVTINGALTLDFIVDSGASDVTIPADVILTLMRTGTIRQSDFVGTRTYTLADGSTVPSPTLIIRTLKVGDREVQNVMASVADIKGSLLLGQSFFKAFQSWSINNARGEIILK